jgi:serine/threonine protein kinase
MEKPRLSRELLVADIVLARGLTSARAVAAALQRYWEARGRSPSAFAALLQEMAGVDRAQLDSVHAEADRLMREASGDARKALADRARSGHSIQLTLDAQPVPGGGPAPRLLDDSLRTAPDERFEDCLIAGEGGMGVVYMAFDTELHRFVALKMIRPPSPPGAQADTPLSPLEIEPPSLDTVEVAQYTELRQRFLQEAWITGGLEHPGIVPVYELGQTTQGVPFYTMRFVSGHRTLADAISEVRNQGIAERLALLEPFLKICDAVEYAHSRDVLHRDLKPHNVALGEYGEVLVLDWGLAKVGGEQQPSSDPLKEQVHEYRASGAFETQLLAIGTPGYMAPEAAAGKVEAIDARSDVYSLGAMLYEILAGCLPYEVDSYLEWVKRITTEPPPDPTHADPTIPAGLAEVALGALSADPALRPARAGALARAVRTWQAADAEKRELDRLEREAREAIAHAEATRSNERARNAERATFLLRRVADARAERSATAQLQGLADQLRARGLRERTWQIARRQLLLAGVVVGVVAATWFLLERARVDRLRSGMDRDVAAMRSSLASSRPDEVLQVVEDARRRVAQARAEHDIDEQEAARRRLALVRLGLGAHIQKGDVGAWSKAALQAISEEEAGNRVALRSIFVSDCARVGAFHTIRNLIGSDAPTSPDDREHLLDAHLWLGDAAAAHALAKQAGDTMALELLDRYALLRTIPLKGVRGLLVVPDANGSARLLALTEPGELHWVDAPAESAGTKVPIKKKDLLRGGYVEASETAGHVVVVGYSKVPDGSDHNGKAQFKEYGRVQEVSLQTGEVTLIHGELRGRDKEQNEEQRMDSIPKLRPLDVDGDGTNEYVLLFGANERGIRVLDADFTPWSPERLGGAEWLHSSNKQKHRSDVQDAVVYPDPSGKSPIFLVGTSVWDQSRYGYRVHAFRWQGDGAGQLRSIPGESRLLGCVQGLGLRRVHGVSQPEVCAWVSCDPMPEHGAVFDDFVLHGMHRLDPVSLASEALFHVDQGLYISARFGLTAAGSHWRFSPLGTVAVAVGEDALATAVSVGRKSYLMRQGALQLLVPVRRTEGTLRAWVIPEARIGSGPANLVQADVLPAHAGAELVVYSPGDRIMVLGQRGTKPRPQGQPSSRSSDGQALAWRLAEGLLADGWAEAAAEMFETIGEDRAQAKSSGATDLAAQFEGRTQSGPVNASDRPWLRAHEAWLGARDLRRCLQALGRSLAENELPRVEYLLRTARIAEIQDSHSGAAIHIEAARGALASPRLQADLAARLGDQGARAVADEIEATKRRIDALTHEFTYRATWPKVEGGFLPEGWESTRPRMTRLDRDGRGLRVALNGQHGDDFTGINVTVRSADVVRVWARLVVEDLEYGSELCLGISESAVPNYPGAEDSENALWMCLLRGDGLPRGIGIGSRVGGRLMAPRAARRAGFHWERDIPVRMEILIDGQRSIAQFICRDELSGDLISWDRLKLEAPLRPGTYRVGLWGTARRTQWNRTTRCLLLDLGCEVASRTPNPAEALPARPLVALETGFREIWQRYRATGDATATAAELDVAVASDKALIALLRGPGPEAAAPVVVALLARRPAIRRFLVLANHDAEMVSELYIAGHIQLDANDPDYEDERNAVLRALDMAGHLKDASDLRLGQDRPVSPDLAAALDGQRSRYAKYLYRDGIALRTYLQASLSGRLGRAKLWYALRECLFGAIVRGEDDLAQDYLQQLMGWPGPAPERLTDHPAVRRYIEGGADSGER